MPFYTGSNNARVNLNMNSALYSPVDSSGYNTNRISSGTPTNFYANGVQIYYNTSGAYRDLWSGSLQLNSAGNTVLSGLPTGSPGNGAFFLVQYSYNKNGSTGTSSFYSQNLPKTETASGITMTINSMTPGLNTITFNTSTVVQGGQPYIIITVTRIAILS